ncbi:MAG: hypothetical protein KGZ79_11890 [Dethiobacter sp.]|nr:hypothetical protein [Dethiobacter sp.]
MRRRQSYQAEIKGPVKLDRKTKNLVERLQPGDIALINHRDLDEMAALSLCRANVKAVINAESSISGSYPNNGPLKLAEAGIYHLDQAGEDLFERVREGDILTVRGCSIYKDSAVLAGCRLVDKKIIDSKLSEAQNNLNGLLDGFVQNTLEYAMREKELILGKLDFPALETVFKDRHALVVVRGQSYREDLLAIRQYLEEVRPILIGVDGGADALLEFGLTPHLIVGDMDSVSDHALHIAGELVVHAYTDGRAPGLERLRKLGQSAKVCRAPGTSEDIALLMAYELGAKLIAAVGTHSNMIDFLEKGRKGMASTFLVRLKVGSRLVDARGISQLYRGGVSGRSLLLITVAAAIPVVVLIMTNPTIRHIFRLFILRLRML